MRSTDPPRVGAVESPELTHDSGVEPAIELLEPPTTRTPMADPQPAGSSTRSSMVSLLAENSRRRNIPHYAEELLARVRNANFTYDEAVLEALHFASELGGSARGAVWRFAGDLVAKMDFEEIEALERDGELASQLLARFIQESKRDPRTHFALYGYGNATYTSDDLRIAARSLLAYRYLATLPMRSFYSDEEFEKLAAIERAPITVFARAFRFDARSIDEIRRAGGFFPNPARVRGTLHEHSAPGRGSFGGGFISMSRREGNQFNLAIGPVLMAMDSVETRTGNVELLRTWEYEIANVNATTPKASHAIEGEEELVTNVVGVERITRSRQVLVSAHVVRMRSGMIEDYKFIDATFDDWMLAPRLGAG